MSTSITSQCPRLERDFEVEENAHITGADRWRHLTIQSLSYDGYIFFPDTIGCSCFWNGSQKLWNVGGLFVKARLENTSASAGSLARGQFNYRASFGVVAAGIQSDSQFASRVVADESILPLTHSITPRRVNSPCAAIIIWLALIRHGFVFGQNIHNVASAAVVVVATTKIVGNLIIAHKGPTKMLIFWRKPLASF